MCGIAGYKGFNFSEKIIHNMVKSLTHRGPNGSGTFVHNDFAIGMSRLSIIDIEGGNQPIFSQDKRYAIVFNGEIYNYKDLQKILNSKGKHLSTNSDTEVILALYEVYGVEALQWLRGMFAFAIVDFVTREIFIARDRVGIKPLYYWHDGTKFAFASEIKALLEIECIKSSTQPDKAAIEKYLNFRYSPGSGSMFSGIKKFPAAHWLRLSEKQTSLQFKRYWEPSIEPDTILSKKEALESFETVFDEAVRLRLIGEVPVGAYLSGGIDSTSIVESMARQTTGTLKTFTVGFGWEGDELEKARNTSQLLGTEHHEIECMPKHLELLPEIIKKCDEPLGDPIVLPTFLLAKEAQRHVTVVLSGEGADEFFGGYAFHKVLKYVSLYRKLCPSPLHKILISPAFSMLPAAFLNKLFNYPADIGQKGREKLVDYVKKIKSHSSEDTFYELISLFSDPEKKRLYTDVFYKEALLNKETSEIKKNKSVKSLQEYIEMQFEHWLPDNMLMRQDKTSMANSLEVRVPFLDHKLIELSYRIPEHLKLGKKGNKQVVREALQRRLPGYDTRSKKQPFYFPFEKMYASHNFKKLVDNCLNPSILQKRGYFRSEIVNELLAKMDKGDFLASKQIFALISLELWFQIFFDPS